nr:unnamed protein product [Callosobruchus chinensis]
MFLLELHKRLTEDWQLRRLEQPNISRNLRSMICEVKNDEHSSPRQHYCDQTNNSELNESESEEVSMLEQTISELKEDRLDRDHYIKCLQK